MSKVVMPEIVDKMSRYYRNMTPWISEVRKWFTDLRWDFRQSLWAQKEFVMPEIVKKITDWYWTVEWQKCMCCADLKHNNALWSTSGVAKDLVMRCFPNTVETVHYQLMKFKEDLCVVVVRNRSGLQRCSHARNSRQNSHINIRRLIDKIGVKGMWSWKHRQRTSSLYIPSSLLIYKNYI